MSTVKNEKISENLQQRTLVDERGNTIPGRPTVLMYSWLLAKSQHLYKYGDFYFDKGFDIVYIKVNPYQVLMPAKAKNVAGELLNFIDREKKESKLLIHGFSVGGYIYGETLVKLESDAKYGHINKNIIGQVWDSVADFAAVPDGFSKAVTPIVPLQKAMRLAIEAYMKIMHAPVTKHYLRASAAYKHNKLDLPTLFLCSTIDPVSCVKTMEEDCIKPWELRGLPVFVKRWNDSLHVRHMMQHPEEYQEAMENFLQFLKERKAW